MNSSATCTHNQISIFPHDGTLNGPPSVLVGESPDVRDITPSNYTQSVHKTFDRFLDQRSLDPNNSKMNVTVGRNTIENNYPSISKSNNDNTEMAPAFVNPNRRADNQ
jgi:hypothetical protein